MSVEYLGCYAVFALGMGSCTGWHHSITCHYHYFIYRLCHHNTFAVRNLVSENRELDFVSFWFDWFSHSPFDFEKRALSFYFYYQLKSLRTKMFMKIVIHSFLSFCLFISVLLVQMAKWKVVAFIISSRDRLVPNSVHRWALYLHLRMPLRHQWIRSDFVIRSMIYWVST